MGQILPEVVEKSPALPRIGCVGGVGKFLKNFFNLYNFCRYRK
jgi:hypothetical protein